MKTKLFVLTLAAAAGTASAQNSIVNDRPGTFVDISALPGAHALITGTANIDDTSYAFTSTVTNAMFSSTTVRPCSDGYVQFGGTAGSAVYTNAAIAAGTVSPVTPTNSQAIFPFWDDLYIHPDQGENIHWIEGSAASFGLNPAYGNVLIVQWTRVQHYLFTTALQPTGEATFQVQVFQNPINSVAAQIVYSDVTFDDGTFDGGFTATVGLASGTTGGAASLSNVQWSFNGDVGLLMDNSVLSILLPTTPTPPTVTGTANPVSVQPGDTVLYTATAVGGINPNSTGLAVHGDLTAVGGGSNVLFHDDGLNGDAVAGDHVFSYQQGMPAAQPGGGYSVTLTVTDAQGRTGNGAITGNVFNPLNLGDLTTAEITVDQTITNAAPGEVHWFRMTLPGVSTLDGGYVDIWASPIDPTNLITAEDLDDTDLALYTPDGTLVSYDDLTGPGFFGQLSYGSTTARPANAFPGQTAGTVFTGQNGVLSEGQYYLAVGQYTMAHPASVTGNWGAVTSNYTGTRNTTTVHIHSFPSTAPYAPTGTGAVSPSSAQALDLVLFTVTVIPGGNPASTGIAVTGDISGIGGGSSVAFHDDGLGGDASAGDGIYSYQYMIPNSAPVGPYSVPVTVADAQSRSSSLSIAGAVVVPPDALDLGQIGAGAGGSEVVTTHDTDIFPTTITWLKFSIGTNVINDGSGRYLDIDTQPASDDGLPAIGSINDTELAVYASSGLMVATDDDDGSDYHTQLSFGDSGSPREQFPGTGNNAVGGNGRDGQLTAGTYYLAAGCFNAIFNNGFDATTTSTAAGTIQVNFRTNIPGGGASTCSPADVGIAGGLAGHDHLLNNNDFIAFITLFFANDAQADMGVAGGVPGSDGLWNNNDFIAFISHFFNDAAHCNG